ncbi:MAG: DUF1631 family protein, partial [Burkholderiales bacterium]|nr:DUF1631 family protein [Burkholderiales bacterium]
HADSVQLASQARRMYTEELVKGLPGVVRQIVETARVALDKPAEYQTAQRRRDLMQSLQKSARVWLDAMSHGIRHVQAHGVTSTTLPKDLPRPGSTAGLALVDDDTIEREILTSRLALAIMDRATWEFADLRSRVAMLERRQELDTHDALRAHVFARVVHDAWRTAGLSADEWREAQAAVHDEFAHLSEGAYHETNRWLVSQRVMPEVDLRPYIRRQRDVGVGIGADPGALGSGAPMPHRPAVMGSGGRGGLAPLSTTGYRSGGGVGEETRQMTRAAPLARGSDHAEAVLGRLNRLVGRHLPGFADTARPALPMTPKLSRAIDLAQRSISQHLTAPPGVTAPAITTPMLLEEVQQRKTALKAAATTPAERATIEIVAMMFQSILTEERIPAQVRVWFARLQMPVLRVAVSEPDFFATIDHPARRLIDRMGACVMGFDSAARGVGDALEKEIKRVVQVVEAYPDTGRRVFQTVLTEFEKFLEHYFRNQNEATKKGVSLAQQVEQRETMAIQYTIELRRMLNEVPVQEGVRQFLFHVWADVLAMTGVQYGAQSEQTRNMKRAAADLIWSASAKVTREERGEVIRRLPPLLKRLRDGMAAAGINAERQDEQIQALNNSLAAAFTAKAALIPTERLTELMERLETLEELLPDAANLEVDESVVLDLSGHESSELEVVSDGGSMPTPAMLAWARELLVGSWYMLDYRGHNEAVQLAWHGLRRQLSLFVSANGRCVLFQHQRLAAFLQAGLLLPAQDESLTVKATRSALAKLDADPSQLMN